MEIKFANNASTLLLDNILEGTTLLNVLPDTGDLFPELHDPADYFKITLVNPGDGSYEIMHVTKVEGDQFTVERGKENTIALQFPQNSIVENRLTAGSIEHILNDVGASGTGTVRSDWHVCDGTNGTPDLRSKFVRGVSSDVPLNSTGGSATNTGTVTVNDTTLTIDQIPSHVHDTNVFAVRGPFFGTSHSNVLGWDASHQWHTTNNSTNYTGGSKAHTHAATIADMDNIPPYYAMNYIMKIN